MKLENKSDFTVRTESDILLAKLRLSEGVAMRIAGPTYKVQKRGPLDSSSFCDKVVSFSVH